MFLRIVFLLSFSFFFTICKFLILFHAKLSLAKLAGVFMLLHNSRVRVQILYRKRKSCLFNYNRKRQEKIKI